MIKASYTPIFDDPAKFVKLYWPHITLYDKQLEIMESVRDNDETVVPAGNMLGKDFIAGLIALWFFCTRTPARVLTTSVNHTQLEGVLWGEIRRFIHDAVQPLPILVNHLHIRQLTDTRGTVEPRSEIVAVVANQGEGYLGRHIESTDGRPRTLAIFDEASGIDQPTYEATDTWAQRKLVIGNPYPCTNFFYRGTKEGDKPDPYFPGRYYRKVIQIKAIDSPNVKMGQFAVNHKLTIPPNIIPGVMPFEEYRKRIETWDMMRLSIGIHAEFYEGAEVRLFPPMWMAASEQLARELEAKGTRRIGQVMGIDGAEGGDSTVWTIVDELGVLHITSRKTPDTAVIPDITLMLMKQFSIEPEYVYFDRGGGGTAQANFLRRKLGKANAFPTVAFGEASSDPNRFKRMRTSTQKGFDAERRMTYKNRRAEMYGLLRELLDPAISDRGFAIPFHKNNNEPDSPYKELKRQMTPIPLQLDPEGRLKLPSKRKLNPDSEELSLTEICGCSPDETDSLVLAVYGLFNKRSKIVVGAL